MILLRWRRKLVRRRSYSVGMTGLSIFNIFTENPLTSRRGGFVVWRAAQWYPDLVSHVFSVCTPYTAPSKDFVSTEDLVKGPLPQFAYQLHLASGEVEKSVKDEQSIRQFLMGMYGGRGPNGELVFEPEKGVLAENLPVIGDSRLLYGKVSNDLLRSWPIVMTATRRSKFLEIFPMDGFLSLTMAKEWRTRTRMLDNSVSLYALPL
jgi:hypothetical protein